MNLAEIYVPPKSKRPDSASDGVRPDVSEASGLSRFTSCNVTSDLVSAPAMIAAGPLIHFTPSHGWVSFTSSSTANMVANTSHGANSASAGELLDAASLERRRKKQTLSSLILHFVREGYSSDSDLDRRIAADTAKAAIRLLETLPSNVVLPRVAPDDDGSLTLLWVNGAEEVLGVVDGWLLHYIVKPTTKSAVYGGPVHIANDKLPAALVEALA